MGIFDAIHVAEGALAVHRYRSEIAAELILTNRTEAPNTELLPAISAGES